LGYSEMLDAATSDVTSALARFGIRPRAGR
jgi:hypothetical protein